MAIGLLKIGKRIKEQTVLNEILPPQYVFSSSLDSNVYNDITSNVNWVGVGKSSHDFLFCRNQIMMWTAVNGFSGLTTEEKQIAAQNFAVGPTERSEVYSDSELKGFWGEFLVNSQRARNYRWNAAKSYISYVLPMADSIDLGKSTTDLSFQYITYGIEDYTSDGVAGLFDWLENTNIYSGGTGFSGKTYWTQEHQDNMMTILRDGIY